MTALEILSLLVNSATLALLAGVAFKSGRWAGRIEEKIANLERAFLSHGGIGL